MDVARQRSVLIISAIPGGLGGLNCNQHEIFVGSHHDLLVAGFDFEESQIIGRIQIPDQTFGLHRQKGDILGIVLAYINLNRTIFLIVLEGGPDDAAVIVDDDDALDGALDAVDGLFHVFCHWSWGWRFI